MKNKMLTGISTLMLFIPWTILTLRSFDWALESPAAEIIITCYAVFMVFSGIFTLFAYQRANLQTNRMKACLVINSLYAAFGLLALAMIALPKIL